MRKVQEAPCPRQQGRVMRALPLLLPLPVSAQRCSAAAEEKEEERPPCLPPAPAVLDIPPQPSYTEATNLMSVPGNSIINIISDDVGGISPSSSRPVEAAQRGAARHQGAAERGGGARGCAEPPRYPDR